jgi:trimethylamine---corrinoid protein Co-methyltransferase
MSGRSLEGYADIAFGMLTLPQIEKIHQASLDILEQTGVMVRNASVLERLKQAGASIDGERVRLKPQFVERALATAPQSIPIYSRGGETAMCLEGWNCYFGTGSVCPSAIDPDTHQHRPSTKAAVGRIAALCDKLPNIDFCMSMGIAWNASTETSFVHQFDVMARHTSNGLAKLLFCAEHKIPMIYISSPMLGASASVTVAGCVALANRAW